MSKTNPDYVAKAVDTRTPAQRLLDLLKVPNDAWKVLRTENVGERGIVLLAHNDGDGYAVLSQVPDHINDDAWAWVEHYGRYLDAKMQFTDSVLKWTQIQHDRKIQRKVRKASELAAEKGAKVSWLELDFFSYFIHPQGMPRVQAQMMGAAS